MTPNHDPDLLGIIIKAWLWCLVAGCLLSLLTTGCVTRTTVCVETQHGVGARDEYGGRRDTVGGSACVDVERP